MRAAASDRATAGVERVTRRFYTRLRAACESFVKSIRGVSGEAEGRSIASVAINRLMFIYFLQKKGFLDADVEYLRSRLCESKRRGANLFYTDFMRRLFFEGFAKKESERSSVAGPLLGAVPYLGDDFFARDQSERLFARGVSIGDSAFERLFDFFDRYEWSLDDGPAREGDPINPDMIGYIFERHVNQEQTGAYYTKEDITEHICRSTIIPFLLDRARGLNGYFDSDGPAWRLLQTDPDRYVYEAVKKACALATETWRETAARKRAYESLRAEMSRGEVRAVNDLVTHNLDLRRFAEDAIRCCESADALKTFWQALGSVTVLDPTCGSGAFLLAAMKTLEPLYAACFDRMEFFVEEARRQNKPDKEENLLEFVRALDGARAHPNRRYFIYKLIIANNLFGVDIMREAVELCKMRLLLRLAAEAGRGGGSLPEISFNVRAGNALVGYASRAEARREPKGRLDGRLASEYEVDPTDHKAYGQWLAFHDPFHWRAEFYRVMEGGGFDVIIGNPPYVSAAKVRGQYSVKNYLTADCPDVYAWVMERSAALLRTGGRVGMIVPLSLSFSDEFDACRRLLFREYGENWFSSFARIPSALFSFDVRIRNTIHIGHRSATRDRQHTTRLHRWFEAARPHLFEALSYAPFDAALWRQKVPRPGTAALAHALERCISQSSATVAASLARAVTPHALHFKKSAYNWLTFCRALPPCYNGGGESVPQTKFGVVYFHDAETRDLAFLLLNGKLMFAYWCVTGDDFDLARWMFAAFPLDLRNVPQSAATGLLPLAERLEEEMNRNLTFKMNAGRRVGNYNLARCRAVTDESDAMFAHILGIEDAWQEVELLYSQIVKTDFKD